MKMTISMKQLTDWPMLALGAYLGLITISSLPANGQDRVYPKQGVPISGKLIEVSPDQIVLEVRGKNQTYPTAEVSKLVFDNEPTALDRARELISQQQYDQALEEIKKIESSGLKTSAVQEDFEFYRWYCEGQLGLSGAGDKAAAERGLKTLAGKNRNTHHFYPLCELLGQLAMASSSPEAARPFFALMEKSSSKEIQALADWHMGELELALANSAEARARLQKVANANFNAANMNSIKNLSLVGLARCDCLEGKVSEALEQLNKLVRNNDSADHELFARINNAKGECYLKNNQTQNALICYLQTDLLFFTDAQAHAEALYYLAQLWPKEGNGAKGVDARNRLKSSYASSVWANK
ncbi:MAG: hypothetical protein KDB03_17965 [Planctomycetales bacterium]|nr:hypothetical protein [Planctomycetales bacterium]